jgi:hypothetical protein
MMELQSLNNSFDDTLVYFEGEKVPNVIESASAILLLERRLGVWQAAQKFVNISVGFPFKGRNTTLQEAISTVGGYGRVSKLMRTAAGGGKKDPYRRSRAEVRSSNELIAKPSISKESALAYFKTVETEANELRAYIGKANNTEVDVPWLEAALEAVR